WAIPNRLFALGFPVFAAPAAAPVLRILAASARFGGGQGVIDRRPGNIERLGDLRDRAAGFLELPDLVDGDLGFAALIDAGGLGFGDAFELALFAQVSLEFGKDAEHVEKALAGSG